MPPMPEVLKVAATKVDGCASQVWIMPEVEGEGPSALFRFQGDSDAMTLQCEVEGGDEGLAQDVGASVQSILKLRGKISFTAPGSLPNDGKVIEDRRSYE